MQNSSPSVDEASRRVGLNVLDSQIQESVQRRFWNKVSLPDGNGCMLWTGCGLSTGYGKFTVNRRSVLTHRFSALLAHGAAPSQMHEVAHSCRTPMCVAPDHIRWATSKENSADQLAHGTRNQGQRNGQAKLTRDDVLAIRYFAGEHRVPEAELSALFGVGKESISKIVRRVQWAWV